jgi:hypothetical protein
MVKQTMKEETLEERVTNLEKQLELHKKICFSQRRWLILGVLISTVSLILRVSEEKKQNDGPLIEYINELIIEEDENKTDPSPTDRPDTKRLRTDGKP